MCYSSSPPHHSYTHFTILNRFPNQVLPLRLELLLVILCISILSPCPPSFLKLALLFTAASPLSTISSSSSFLSTSAGLGTTVPSTSTSSNGNEEEDDDWEAYCGNRLCDREGGAETDELKGDEEPDGLLALEAPKWVRGGSKVIIASEVEDFVGDAVCLQCLDSHDEEEACKDTTGN